MAGRVCVLTYTPSPYQVELFDKVQADGSVQLDVLYLHDREHGRLWSDRPRQHASAVLGPDDKGQAFADALARVESADLFVLNYYQDPRAARLLQARVATHKAWAFWGERPGFRHLLLGRLLRRWKLRALHQSHAPIWGIGGWAVRAYQSEFGGRRPYVNLPYFSNLDRFQSCGHPGSAMPLTFLFSGALTLRKGVDLLAEAYARLAGMSPEVRLVFMGSGAGEANLRARLAAFADRVSFTGFVDWDRLPEAYRAAHVLCVPSRHDGWGLVVPEGLASGLPVIGTDRTGAALDFIKEGRNGWLVRAGCSDALFAALHQAASLSHPEWEILSREASASVAHHRLADGAARFAAAASEAMAALPPR